MIYEPAIASDRWRILQVRRIVKPEDGTLFPYKAAMMELDTETWRTLYSGTCIPPR